MKGLLKKSIIALTFASSISLVQAETVYITDVLYVPMRSGPGNDYRILHRGLPSGTAMALLERGETFTKVRLDNGQEGYVRSQYVQSEAVARNELKSTKARFEQLQAENTTLKNDKKSLTNELKTLQDSFANTTADQEDLAIELKRIKEISANSMAIDERNKALVEENLKLKNQLQVTEGEVQKLTGDHRVTWFLSGAGAIFAGLILGLILPNVRTRKKRSDWV